MVFVSIVNKDTEDFIAQHVADGRSIDLDGWIRAAHTADYYNDFMKKADFQEGARKVNL